MADTARTRPGNDGGITSPDYWEARWKQARADAAADTALAIGGPEGHTASEWHSGRFRFHTRGADFVAASSGSLRRCSALLSEDATLPVANTVTTLVPLDTDEYDPDDWHSTATTTHKITVPEEGDYVIFARFTWENDAFTGDVGTRTFTINGTGPDGFYGASRVDPASSTVSHLHQELTHAVHLVAGTSCWMEVLQNSGGALQAALASNRRENPRLTVLKVG